MAKRFLILFASLLLMAFAPADQQNIRDFSLLKNPGFENQRSYWTYNTTNFSITSTAANVGQGTNALSFDAANNGDFIRSSYTPMPSGMYGQTCRAEFLQKGGDANLAARVVDGTGTLVPGATLTLAASTNYTLVTLEFTCPTSGDIAFQILASANAAVVYIDQVYLGLADAVATATNGGDVSTGTQSFAGTKVFTTTLDVGTDTATAGSFNIRKATGQRPEANWYKAGTARLTLGVASAGNDLVTGSSSDDVVIRSNNTNILFTADNGSTVQARISTSGEQSYGALDANVKVGGYFHGTAMVSLSADCTASPCTIDADYGNMLNTVTRSATGTYTLNFTSSFWSAGPACTVSGTGGGNQVCLLNTSGLSATSYGVKCKTANTGADVDSRFSVTCHGPR